MKFFRRLMNGFDNTAIRAYLVTNRRREYLWYESVVGLAGMYVMYHVLSTGSDVNAGLVHLLMGAWLPLISIIVIFMAWPQIKPGATKPVIKDIYLVLIGAGMIIGSWYRFGPEVGTLLISAAAVLGVLIAGNFGLKRLAMVPFVFGLISPIVMAVTDVPSNLLLASFDRALVALSIPVRGWDEVSAMLCLILVIYSPIHVAMQQRGSSAYFKQVALTNQVLQEDFLTQPNIVRVATRTGVQRGVAAVKQGAHNRRVNRLERASARVAKDEQAAMVDHEQPVTQAPREDMTIAEMLDEEPQWQGVGDFLGGDQLVSGQVVRSHAS